MVINMSEEKKTKDSQASEDYRNSHTLPEINFSTFVVSLNASALVNLGVMTDPLKGEKTKNTGLAKQTIDILNMLEEKTRGNLTKDEENILKNILYDLRIIYVKELGK